ncbi:AAA domain-containing protein [Synechococcus sp. M16CYN]|uniref:AAA domain-containing protein n=1 Tax=Synechococcus sp. M16CYN TaxID=3103139 RepID=UPI00324EE30D
MTTLERLLQSVFAGKNFESRHKQIEDNDIFVSLARLPFSLSKSQKTAIYRALQNDISYIQGPPGTGKSFTISALAITASEIGMKVLVASQKKPAVDIVYKNVTDILGDSACLYISDDKRTKQKTRGVINDLLSRATDCQTSIEENELERLSKTVDTLIVEKQNYASKIFNLESELRQYYNNNQRALDCRKILEEDFALSETIIKKINPIQNNKSRLKARRMLKECINIRELSRCSGGEISLKEAVRLKILSTAVLRALNFEIEQYNQYKEEVLILTLTYLSYFADAQQLQRSVVNQPLEVIRKTFERRNNELYPSNPKESILAELLSSSHSIRVNNLLQNSKYRDALDAFYKRLYWKSINRVKSANAKIEFDMLFQVFPIVMGEIKSLHPYLPFEAEPFDLLILDEASQVNLAEIFPILFRAKRFCIVGDHKQLGIKSGGVIFLSKVFEKLTWNKYFSGLPGYPLDFKTAGDRDLLVSESSILDLIRNDLNPVTAAPVLLNEHFRSLPMLAEFTSDQFYSDEGSGKGLRIMTALPENKAINAFMDLQVSTKREENSQINKGEVDCAFEIIESFARNTPTPLTQSVFLIAPLAHNEFINVGVVSFIRDQVNFMKEEALRRLSDEEQDNISLMIGTPEEFQGNERDVIIFTPSLDEEQKHSKAFMEDQNRFNVATSRAKYFTYFIHGKLPSNMLLMRQMLAKMGQGIKNIKDIDLGYLPIGWTYEPLACESEFELIVADVISDLIQSDYPQRLVLYNQVHTCGFRLDLVVYDRLTKKAVGIEVDGKHHYLADGSTYTDDHLERANALKRAGWTIKYLPYWDWFQDGWIEKDATAAKNLCQFIRESFY